MAELEVAAENDAELNRQGKPAITKLRKLYLLTDVLSKLVTFPLISWLGFFAHKTVFPIVCNEDCLFCRKQLQQEFLDHGVLTLLKNWLEPLPDGSLPNINVRAAVLKILNDVWK